MSAKTGNSKYRRDIFFAGCYTRIKRPAGVVCDLEAGGQGVLSKRVGAEMSCQDASVEARVRDDRLHCLIAPECAVGWLDLTPGLAWLWRSRTVRITVRRR